MLSAIVKKNKILLIFFTLFLLLRVPSLFEPYWYGDEGIYLVLGQAIRKGLLLFRDIHDNKPPTLYYLAALGQTVFGFRLLLLLWMLPTLYTFYLLSKKILTGSLLLISNFLFLISTSIPFFEGTIANAEIFMLLPTILAVYLFFSIPVSRIQFLVSGLLLGFAFTIKVPVFIELAFLCFWLLISNFNFRKIKFLVTSYLLLVSGFLLPIVLYLLYFWQQGALGEFLFAALLQNFGYLSSWTTGSHSGSATGGGLATRGIWLFGFWILIAIVYLKKYINQKTAILLLWFSSTIFGALLSTRPYPHYLIQVLAPLCLLLSYLFIPKLTKFSLYLILGTQVFLVFLFFKYRFYAYPVFSYYTNFYSYAAGLKSAEKYQLYFGSRLPEIYQISEKIKSETSPREKIFVWGDEPYIYALADRLPVGKYTVAYHIVDFDGYQPIYQNLITNFPKFIVYVPQESRPYPELEKLVKSYYFISATYGDFRLYQRLE